MLDRAFLLIILQLPAPPGSEVVSRVARFQKAANLGEHSQSEKRPGDKGDYREPQQDVGAEFVRRERRGSAEYAEEELEIADEDQVLTDLARLLCEDTDWPRRLMARGERDADRLGQFFRAGKALGRVLGETAMDRIAQFRRESWDGRGDERRRLRDVLREQGANGGRLERQPAGEGVVGDDAQRVDVAAVIGDLAARLLGAHVVRGAEDLAGAGDGGILRDASDAEVHHERAARGALDHDVVGLHVAVDDALRMRVGESPADVAQDLSELRRRHRPASSDAVAERLAVDERHDEEHDVVDVVHGKDRNDVRVRQFGGGARFVQEALLERGLTGQMRLENLERHRPLECDVLREVHDSHAAAAELPLQRVASPERASQL